MLKGHNKYSSNEIYGQENTLYVTLSLTKGEGVTILPLNLSKNWLIIVVCF